MTENPSRNNVISERPNLVQ